MTVEARSHALALAACASCPSCLSAPALPRNRIKAWPAFQMLLNERGLSPWRLLSSCKPACCDGTKIELGINTGTGIDETRLWRHTAPWGHKSSTLHIHPYKLPTSTKQQRKQALPTLIGYLAASCCNSRTSSFCSRTSAVSLRPRLFKLSSGLTAGRESRVLGLGNPRCKTCTHSN